MTGRGAPTESYPYRLDHQARSYAQWQAWIDTFGTRSLQFVYSMLNGLGHATEDHSVNHGLLPGNSRPTRIKCRTRRHFWGAAERRDRSNAGSAHGCHQYRV